MKKFFENPKMELNMFHTENVVTVSGEVSEQTAEQLEANGYLVQNISVKDVTFTF